MVLVGDDSLDRVDLGGAQSLPCVQSEPPGERPDWVLAAAIPLPVARALDVAFLIQAERPVDKDRPGATSVPQIGFDLPVAASFGFLLPAGTAVDSLVEPAGAGGVRGHLAAGPPAAAPRIPGLAGTLRARSSDVAAGGRVQLAALHAPGLDRAAWTRLGRVRDHLAGLPQGAPREGDHRADVRVDLRLWAELAVPEDWVLAWHPLTMDHFGHWLVIPSL